MLARTAIWIAAATAALTATSAAEAAYLTLGGPNSSNASTTLSGNTSNGPELRVVNTNTAQAALAGQATGAGANAFGVLGLLTTVTPSVDSAAVRGKNSAVNDRGFGVWGSQAGGGIGVYGTAAAGTGVRGRSGTGAGVYGYHAGATGSGAGVEGHTASKVSYTSAVLGRVDASPPAPGSAGIRGEGRNGAIAVGGLGGTGGYGLIACATGQLPPYSDCVDGSPSSNVAAQIAAVGTQSVGVDVRARGTGALGAYVLSDGSGMIVVSNAKALTASSSDDTVSTYSAGTYKSGIYAEHSTMQPGWAGYFTGDVLVSGTLSKGAGMFRIDHPLDPAHKYLQHSFVESPDMKNVYDGVVMTNGLGFATIRLPHYFQALNRTFRYQLTIVGTRGWNARVVKEIAHNSFTIQTDAPRVKVSWQVTGIRHDRYANAHRIPVESAKRAADQGRYLHPELYGKPRAKMIGYRKPAQAP